MKISSQKIIDSVKIIIIALLVAFGIQYIYAFTAPPGAPTICPTGYPGCDAPINVSSTTQTKLGSLMVNGSTTEQNLVGLYAWGQSVFNYGGVGASAIQIIDGNQGAGKVLTSDASGNGTWATPSSSASSSVLTLLAAPYTLGSGAVPAGIDGGYLLSAAGVPSNATAVLVEGTMTLSNSVAGQVNVAGNLYVLDGYTSLPTNSARHRLAYINGVASFAGSGSNILQQSDSGFTVVPLTNGLGGPQLEISSSASYGTGNASVSVVGYYTGTLSQ